MLGYQSFHDERLKLIVMLNPVKDWITRCHRLHKTLFKFTDYKEFMGGGGEGQGGGIPLYVVLALVIFFGAGC